MASPAATSPATTSRRSILLWCIVIAIVCLIVLVGLVVLFVWVAIRPRELVYTVESGKVSGFELHKNHLNATFDFVLRAYNPNRRIALYYDSLNVAVSYDDQTVAFETLEPFFQPRHNVTRIEARAKAQSVALQSSVAKDLRLEKASGEVDLEIRMKARIRFKIGSWKSSHYTLRVKCSKVEVHPNTNLMFKQKKCDVDT